MTITGELKSKIDSVWDDFWSCGISNPLEVMEQLTYLLFIKGLDETHTRDENKANRLGTPIENPVFPDSDAPTGRPYADLRWSLFKDFEAREMFDVVDNHVFPFLQERAGDSSHAVPFWGRLEMHCGRPSTRRERRCLAPLGMVTNGQGVAGSRSPSEHAGRIRSADATK